MSNSTQSYRLFQLLKAGDVVSKEVIAETLGVVLVSVPVYIHELKSQFKAEIKGVREGRKVIGYKLLSTDLDVPQYRRNSIHIPDSQKVKKPKKTAVVESAPVEAVTAPVVDDGSVPVLDKDAEITQYNDRELSDVRESLGLGSFGGSYE